MWCFIICHSVYSLWMMMFIFDTLMISGNDISDRYYRRYYKVMRLFVVHLYVQEESTWVSVITLQSRSASFITESLISLVFITIIDVTLLYLIIIQNQYLSYLYNKSLFVPLTWSSSNVRSSEIYNFFFSKWNFIELLSTLWHLSLKKFRTKQFKWN